MLVNAMRQWWTRYGVTTGFSIAVILGAWSFRESNGRIAYEIYSQISQPFGIPEDRTKQMLLDARTEELSARVAEQRQENARLQAAIDRAPTDLGEPTFAPLLGRSADHWWQQITIGRGAVDGVAEGDVVIAPGGLIGRVTSVSSRASRILLVSDPTSRVGVTVTRSRAMGVMRGLGDETVSIEFFDKLPDVKVGDAIVSSQFSQRFPAGIPIGEVTAVDLSASPAPQAEVKLFAPLAILEWVSVYPKPDIPLAPLENDESEVEILMDDDE